MSFSMAGEISLRPRVSGPASAVSLSGQMRESAHSAFSDALVGTLAARAICTRTLTFDRSALGLAGFELL
jgi:predicted nucleic-acid-binding protein